MAVDTNAIVRNIDDIRNKVYGKDVIKAIADGIENCYQYAIENVDISEAEEVTEEISSLVLVVDNTRKAMDELQNIVDNADEEIVISKERPMHSENKIWIKPLSEKEYNIASFEAYSSMWALVNDLNNSYCDGHGGIVSILLDENYIDGSEKNIAEADRRIKKYVITFSDGYESEWLLTNSVGPKDVIQDNGVVIEYAKGEIDDEGNFVKEPPFGDAWLSALPDLNPGDYIWTRTTNIFKGGNVNMVYAVGRFGKTGSDGINYIKIGDSGTARTDNIVIPLDANPTENHSDYLMSSGDVWSAIQNFKVSPSFTGTPTAPTPMAGTSSEQIATTSFVQNILSNTEAVKNKLLDSPCFTGNPTVSYESSMAAGAHDNRIAVTNVMYSEAKYLTQYFSIGHSIQYELFAAYHESVNLNMETPSIRIGVPDFSSHMIFISSSNPKMCNAVFLVYADSHESHLPVVQPLSLGYCVNYTADDNNNTSGELIVNISSDGIHTLTNFKISILDIILHAESIYYSNPTTYQPWPIDAHVVIS